MIALLGRTGVVFVRLLGFSTEAPLSLSSRHALVVATK
jgi:hypothetical protein